MAATVNKIALFIFITYVTYTVSLNTLDRFMLANNEHGGIHVSFHFVAQSWGNYVDNENDLILNSHLRVEVYS